jgi:hypothetical protein
VDEFRAVQTGLRRCGVSGWWVKVLADLDDERRGMLEAAAADPEIMHRTIAVVLEQWGFDVNVGQVGHWRRNHVW